VIVLNYHELAAASPPTAWCLTHEMFDAHLALCRDRLVSPSVFLEHCHDPKASRASAVLLTLDDGFLTDYTHVYARYVATDRVPGFVSFIPVNFVGQPGRMSWEMIAELGRNDIAIGSHGMAHVDLTTVSNAELDSELVVSKSILEDRLGRPVTLFAFPYGRFSRRVWEAALEAGYTHLFTIQLGHHQGFEPFLFSRICLTNNMDTEYMRQHLLDPDARRSFVWRVSTRLGLYSQLMRWQYR
jgi:peptidoglycan/xylan/chitin deacetylase (PgdA/CDA1 family)